MHVEPALTAGAFGTALVILMVAPEPSASTAAWSVGAASTVVLAGIAHSLWAGRLTLRPAALAVRAGMAYWLLMPAVAVALGGRTVYSRSLFVYRYAGYTTSPQDAMESISLILYFYLTFLIVESLFFRPGSIAPTNTARLDSLTVRRLANYSLLTVAMGFILFLLLAGGNPVNLMRLVASGRGGDTPWRSTGITGGPLATVRVFATGLMIGGSASALALVALYWRAIPLMLRRAAILVSAVAIMLILVESGTRFQLALGILPALLVLLTIPRTSSHRRAAVQQTRKRTLAMLLILVPSLLFISQQVRSNRGASQTIQLSASLDTNDNDFFTATMLATRITRETGAQLESPLAFAVIQLVPNRLWPGTKPYSPSTVRFTMAKWGSDPKADGRTAFGSLVGQYYMSFGVLGPALAGTIFGAWAAIIDSRVYSRRRKITGLPFASAAFLFVSFRVLFGAPAIAMIVTLCIVAIERRTRPASYNPTTPPLPQTVLEGTPELAG